MKIGEILSYSDKQYSYVLYIETINGNIVEGRMMYQVGQPLETGNDLLVGMPVSINIKDYTYVFTTPATAKDKRTLQAGIERRSEFVASHPYNYIQNVEIGSYVRLECVRIDMRDVEGLPRVETHRYPTWEDAMNCLRDCISLSDLEPQR